MTQVIFATKNKDKLQEIREIFNDDSFDVISMEDFGINVDVVEDGETFEENALKKAVEIMKLSNTIVISDDSGLEIDFLGKAPGVLSARYLGEGTSYEYKNRKILEQLEGIEGDERSARFVCCIAVAFPDGTTFTEEGVMEGVIADNIYGANGFGYDPIFYLPQFEKTNAELSREEKNAISHRGIALRNAVKRLKNELEKK